ncbi:effector-associated constant component EACC1 [Actinoplanes xinjiangensis]|uniref:effector-associated constant component EACC1 n=1 Tax=Actinoplanes xinjiangensis TaxID=512350 RepID=UPI00342CFAE0
MEALLRVDAGRGDQARRLRAWLVGDPSLAGRVRLEAAVPAPGELGVGVEALLVALAPGGVAMAVVTGLFGWLRSRSTSVRVRLSRPDGAEVELETTVTGRIPADRLPQMIDALAAWACGSELDPAAAEALEASTTPAVEPVRER